MRVVPLLLAVLSALFITIGLPGCGAQSTRIGDEDGVDADADSDGDADTQAGSNSDCSDFHPGECNGTRGAHTGDRFPPSLPWEFPDCQGETWRYGCDLGKVILYNLTARWSEVD